MNSNLLIVAEFLTLLSTVIAMLARLLFLRYKKLQQKHASAPERDTSVVIPIKDALSISLSSSSPVINVVTVQSPSAPMTTTSSTDVPYTVIANTSIEVLSDV